MEETSRNSRWRSAIFTCNLQAVYYIYISVASLSLACIKTSVIFLLAIVLVGKLCHAALQTSIYKFTLPLHL